MQENETRKEKSLQNARHDFRSCFPSDVISNMLSFVFYSLVIYKANRVAPPPPHVILQKIKFKRKLGKPTWVSKSVSN